MYIDITMKEGLNTAVLFNGKLEKFAIEADDESGRVKRYKTNLDGEIVVDENYNPETEVVIGNVRFVKLEDLKPNMI
jgi:hypothetical protein